MAIFNTINMPIFKMTFGASSVEFRLAFVSRFAIGFIVEIVEEVIEEYGVRQGENNGPTWIAAFVEDQLKRMKKSNAELELKKTIITIKFLSYRS